MSGQTMVAKPRKILFIQKHLINFSMTNTSTMTTCISAIKAPKTIVYEKKNSYRGIRHEGDMLLLLLL